MSNRTNIGPGPSEGITRQGPEQSAADCVIRPFTGNTFAFSLIQPFKPRTPNPDLPHTEEKNAQGRWGMAIALSGLGKLPVYPQLEIARRLCLIAIVWETTHPSARQEPEQGKAFHNLTLAAAAIPSWPRNRGLCSTRAIEVSPQVFPATNPVLSAISAPERRPNSLLASSPIARLMRWERKFVFTHTQIPPEIASLLLQSSRKCLKTSDTRSEGDQNLWLAGFRGKGNLSGYCQCQHSIFSSIPITSK
jgi:hypothetical protein